MILLKCLCKDGLIFNMFTKLNWDVSMPAITESALNTHRSVEVLQGLYSDHVQCILLIPSYEWLLHWWNVVFIKKKRKLNSCLLEKQSKAQLPSYYMPNLIITNLTVIAMSSISLDIKVLDKCKGVPRVNTIRPEVEMCVPNCIAIQ